MIKNKKLLKSIIHKIIFVVVFLVTWETIAKMKIFGNSSELLFPSLEAIATAFIDNFQKGYAGVSLWVYIKNSMELLLEGIFIGIVLSFILSGLSIISNIVYDIYDLLISIFDLLPGIALLPVIIIIFGIRKEVIVFLIVHAVIWPMSRNILDGFNAVPKMYIEAGKNIGLKDVSLLFGVYIPASATYLLSGFKVAWARSWRGLISAEMIFGIASMPGLGLYINQMRTNMENAKMYATLIVIIVIGVIVQYGILGPIEKATIKKWGMVK